MRWVLVIGLGVIIALALVVHAQAGGVAADQWLLLFLAVGLEQ